MSAMSVKNNDLYCRFMYIATSRAKKLLVVLNAEADTLPLQPVLSTSLL